MTNPAKILQTIVAPMLNANEDEVTIVDVCVREGDQVTVGQLLFVVESTKTTSDVLNTDAGYVRNVAVSTGDLTAVGAPLCLIADRADGELRLSPDAPAPSKASPNLPTTCSTTATSPSTDSSVLATNAAQALAELHKIELTTLGLDRIITERDVQHAIDGTCMEDESAETSSRTTFAPATVPFHASSHINPGSSKLVVFGAGNHAKALIDLIRISRPEFAIVAAVDDAPGRSGDVLGVPIVGNSKELRRLRDEGVRYAALGVGAATNPKLRKQLFDKLTSHNFELPSFIHPNASVEPTATMGVGNQIFAGAVVGTVVTLGDNTLINCGCVISHDCKIGSHSHITPGAILAGAVTVGENTTIGMGCTVFLGLRIGDGVVVGNGIHIFEDVEDGAFLRPKRTARRAA